MKQQLLDIMERRGGAEKMLTALLDRAEGGELRAVNMVLVLLGEDTPAPEVQTIRLDPSIEPFAQ